jgi:hypothetical protein
MNQYRCGICRKSVAYAERLPELYPFCSPRCKLIDLGRWFGERYAVQRELTPEEIDQQEQRRRDGQPDEG